MVMDKNKLDTFTIRCKCGKAESTYCYHTDFEVAGFLPAELICTGCREIIKLKDCIPRRKNQNDS